MNDNKNWATWFLALAAATAMVLCGCVNLAPCASYLDDHVDQLIEDSAEVARLIPEDSPARPFIANVYWRTKTRMKPWTREFKRAAGEVVADAPRSPTDGTRVLMENRATQDLATANDLADALPWKTGDWAGFAGKMAGGGILTTILGMIGAGVKKKIRSVEEERDKYRLRSRKGYAAMNAMKAVSPEVAEAVIAHTQNDRDLKEGYREEKTLIEKEARQNRADVLQRCVG